MNVYKINNTFHEQYTSTQRMWQTQPSFSQETFGCEYRIITHTLQMVVANYKQITSKKNKTGSIITWVYKLLIIIIYNQLASKQGDFKWSWATQSKKMLIMISSKTTMILNGFYFDKKFVHFLGSSKCISILKSHCTHRLPLLLYIYPYKGSYECLGPNKHLCKMQNGLKQMRGQNHLAIGN